MCIALTKAVDEMAIFNILSSNSGFRSEEEK